MGLFSNLFNKKTKASNSNPLENTKLLSLMEKSRVANGDQGTYKNVVMELMEGNSILIVPTAADNTKPSEKWTKLEEKKTITITSIFNQDGIKALAAFTDIESLQLWSKQECRYVAMPSKNILTFVQANGIDRIVINSGRLNMFVLERDTSNLKPNNIPENSQINIGEPAHPIEASIIKKFVEKFKKNEMIAEAYQFAQTANGKYNIVLGFKMKSNSENARKSVMNCVQNVLQEVKIDQPMDLLFIEDLSFYETIRNVDNSLIYQQLS